MHTLLVSIAQGLVIYCLLIPFGEALASAKVGDVIKAGARSYRGMPVLIGYISTIAGIALVVTGLQKLRLHVDRPDQVPLSHGIWHLLGGTFLFSLPAAWGMLVRSLKLAAASGSTVSATSIALNTSSSSALSLDVMMIRLISDVRGPIQLAIWTLAAMLGLFFMATAFMRMAKGAAQDGPRGSLGSGTIGRLLIGSILLSLAATSDVFTTTLFSGSIVQFSGMSISGVSAGTLTQANQAVAAILVFVQIIGFIAFMRGFLMLRALADGNNSVSMSAAMTHVIGGAVAINISPMLSALQNTFCAGSAGCAVFNF